MSEQDPAGPAQPAPEAPAGDPSAPAASPAPAAPPAAGADQSRPDASLDAVRLLVKAVGMLPDDERDQVYTWLLSRGLSGPFLTGRLAGRMREVSEQLLPLQAAGAPGQQHLGQQVVPVRFAAEQHAQLRTWCAEHNFSMATVIRGLVARFLEGQLPARN